MIVTVQTRRLQTLERVRAFLAGLLALVSLAAVAGTRIDFNSASAREYAQGLDGVGEARAQATVEHRRAHGDFASVGALVEIDGIGEVTLGKNRERLTASSEQRLRPVGPGPRCSA